MASLISSFFAPGETASDQTMAYMSAVGAAVTANAYFSAALVAVTPEVRQLFGEFSSQLLVGHEQILNLMLHKGWINPYNEAGQQLQSIVAHSMQVLPFEHSHRI